MIFQRVGLLMRASTAFYIACTAAGLLQADQTVTVHSGNGTLGGRDAVVRFLSYQRLGNVAPSAADFVTAQSGPSAFIVPPNGVYLQRLPSDPTALWLGTTPSRSPSSALYAFPFQLTDTTISAASMDLHFSVDNAINGVFINGNRISGNSFDGDYHAEYRFARSDIAPLLLPNSINWLYLNVSDDGGDGALIFNLSLTTQGTGEGVRPSQGGNTGTITVTVSGQNFQDAPATVILRGAGPDIIGLSPQVLTRGSIVTAFNLRGATPGVRDVIVSQAGGPATTFPSAFTVEAGGTDRLGIDIIGPSHIRAGREGTFDVIVTNDGNVDVPLVTLQAGTDVAVKTTALAATIGSCSLPVQSIYVPAGIARTFQLLCTPSGSTCSTLNATINKDEPSNDCSKEEAAVASAEFRVNFLRIELQSLNLQLSNLQQTYAATCNPVTAQNAAQCALLQNEINQKIGEIQVARASLQQAELDLLYAQAALDACRNRQQNRSNALSPLAATEIAATAATIGPPSATSSLSFCGVTSLDPNNKLGVDGAGSAHYLRTTLPLSYTILFENKPSATAAAAEVVITDKLSPALDPATVVFRGLRFGTTNVDVPVGATSLTTSVDLRPATNLFVNISAQVIGDTLTVRFTSIDPTTGKPPTDLRGFLPPNTNPPGGEGSVSFTIMPRQGLATGTQITNTATIVFDTNAPIATPVWLNTVDNAKPVSHVAALPPMQTARTFPLTVSATDVGAGIRDYTLYVSDNGGPFTAITTTTQAEVSFTGTGGHTYRFFSIARDLVNNLEDPKTTPEATATIVDTTAPKLSVTLSPNVLWPPDHKLITITADVRVTDDIDPAPRVVLLSITSNEPDNGLGDGDTAGDIQGAAFGTDDRSFQLRAERSGNGNGRTYTITYRATDAAGNATTVSVPVTVPLNQGK